jgi:AraC family cel operon transcriptional repressor
MRLQLSRFTGDPSHEYASLINDRRQLRIRHNHDYFELFLVNHGSARHLVNGAAQLLKRGSVVFIRPEDTHSYDDMSLDFEIINMLIPAETVKALFVYLGEGFDPQRLLSSVLPPVAQVSLSEHASLVKDLERLVLAKRIQRTSSDAVFRITLMRIIATCFPILPAQKKTEIPLWLQWLTLEMMKRENFVEGFGAMIRLAGKSEEHVSRSCRKYLHKSPTELINELRLEHAARAVAFSGEKIVEISADVGFDSLSHFYHLFKKAYGLSPLAFRKRTKEGSFNEAPFRDTPPLVGIHKGTAI